MRGEKALAIGFLVSVSFFAAEAAADRKAEYVRAVTRGEGWLPWQERGVSAAEQAFRQEIETRKDAILAARGEVQHPVLCTEANFAQARANIDAADWARDLNTGQRQLAEYIIAQPDTWVEQMVPELTPASTYGFTCPHCVGRLSQEGTGASLIGWDYRQPDVITCRRCKHEYPSADYPETVRLVLPRSGQELTFYDNEAERAQPDDRSGKLAYHWVGYPIHVSFSGTIRDRKISFAISATRALAMQYRLTGDVRYAVRCRELLLRLADGYRQWRYHDYWGTFADCDPMYAAWHDMSLPIEWKRHPCEEAYAKDTLDKAAMRQSYWGAGRVHPSTDGIANAATLATAYDLIFDARDTEGKAIWTAKQRRRVERDLLLEYIMGAEPFVGGADQATNVNNKTPSVYYAMAAVARCLGLAKLADTALRGYEGVRDTSFLYDGFSKESPAYTNMYLSSLVQIPEVLQGFTWPAGFAGHSGTVDLFRDDARLRLMFRAIVDQLQPEGCYAPLSDTSRGARPAVHLAEMGARHYPEYYADAMAALYAGRSPSEYAIFHLTPAQIAAGPTLRPADLYFPAWMTALLRHGEGASGSLLAFVLNPEGGHRHADNLSLYYFDRGQTILGDHGYTCDMPTNAWIKSTLSHNLVVVDDAAQESRGRHPRLVRMVTSPRASAVEAASDAYRQCGAYQRLLVMLKEPAGATCSVDIFRVNGGKKHAYRIFSELAASDAEQGSLTFDGLTLDVPAELPNYGASLKKEDIYGLRDVRGTDTPGDAWRAVWSEMGRAYRLWMCAAADRVEASHGPGQQTASQIGRRVRYVDAIRQGENVQSTFVAVHEPSGPDGAFAIRHVERLAVPSQAGADAVALRIESAWGEYLLLSEFADQAEVAGVRFRGALAIVHTDTKGKRWLLAQEAATCRAGSFGFEGATPVWKGSITKHTAQEMVTDVPRPADWQNVHGDAVSYVIATTADGVTGFPVRHMDAERIEVERFPLPEVSAFALPNTRTLAE